MLRCCDGAPAWSWSVRTPPSAPHSVHATKGGSPPFAFHPTPSPVSIFEIMYSKQALDFVRRAAAARVGSPRYHSDGRPGGGTIRCVRTTMVCSSALAAGRVAVEI